MYFDPVLKVLWCSGLKMCAPYLLEFCSGPYQNTCEFGGQSCKFGWARYCFDEDAVMIKLSLMSPPLMGESERRVEATSCEQMIAEYEHEVDLTKDEVQPHDVEEHG